jgi:hypothetical protein
MEPVEAKIAEASKTEQAYYKAGFMEAINILKAVVKWELHGNHHVNELAKETITSIIVTMEEAIGEIDANFRETPKQ